MNIPPMNDLNRDGGDGEPGYFAPVRDFVHSFLTENGSWTSAKDLAVRFAVPLIGMAACALFKHSLEQRAKALQEKETALKIKQKQLEVDRDLFEAEQGISGDKPLVQIINDLMVEENRASHKAIQEIDSLLPLIKDVLKVKCSPFTSRIYRQPMEKQIREKLMKTPSPLDEYQPLKQRMMEDWLQICKQDIQHCDAPYPIGNNDNGVVYKIYMENWKLRVELDKHKHVIEQLRHNAIKKRAETLSKFAKS